MTNDLEKLKQEIIESFDDQFCVMLERADRKDGESSDVWVTQIEEFLSQAIDQTTKAVGESLKIVDDAPITARRFWLLRSEDVSSVSGTGVVADGVVFPDGIAVLRWRTAGGSTAVYDSIESLEAIHGHEGKTKIEYVPDAIDELNQKIDDLLSTIPKTGEATGKEVEE